MDRTADQGISDIVGCLTDPIIVYPGGWGDSLPDWLKTAVTLERLAMNVKALKGEEPTGTDAEACAYLYTASLAAPMGERWTRIYLHVAGRVVRRDRRGEMPPDIAVEKLSDHEMGELRRLKDWLYSKRIEALRERGRAERRERREEEAVGRESDQPALFTL